MLIVRWGIPSNNREPNTKMIADYLQGINNAIAGPKQDVSNVAADLAKLQVGEGSLPSKLKEALNTKLNNNADLISQQSATMQKYFNSGPEAREKYQDVWNPFEKAKLVQQERSMALRPYDTLSGILENRMGNVSDIISAGVQGWQGLVNAVSTKLGIAKDSVATALQAYLAATGQQEAADQLGFQIAQAKEQSRQYERTLAEQARQFGITSGMSQQQIDNQASQFEKELALNKLKISLGGSSGGSGGGGSVNSSDITAIAQGLLDISSTPSAADIAALTDAKNVGKVMAKINEIKVAEKVEVDKLNADKATADAEKRKNSFFAKTGDWLSDYFKGNAFEPTVGGT